MTSLIWTLPLCLFLFLIRPSQKYGVQSKLWTLPLSFLLNPSFSESGVESKLLKRGFGYCSRGLFDGYVLGSDPSLPDRDHGSERSQWPTDFTHPQLRRCKRPHRRTRESVDPRGIVRQNFTDSPSRTTEVIVYRWVEWRSCVCTNVCKKRGLTFRD